MHFKLLSHDETTRERERVEERETITITTIKLLNQQLPYLTMLLLGRGYS